MKSRAHSGNSTNICILINNVLRTAYAQLTGNYHGEVEPRANETRRRTGRCSPASVLWSIVCKYKSLIWQALPSCTDCFLAPPRETAHVLILKLNGWVHPAGLGGGTMSVQPRVSLSSYLTSYGRHWAQREGGDRRASQTKMERDTERAGQQCCFFSCDRTWKCDEEGLKAASCTQRQAARFLPQTLAILAPRNISLFH